MHQASKASMGLFGPLLIFTSARDDESGFGQGLSEASMHLLPSSPRLSQAS